MDSANLENYAWIYVHEDDWDQDGVLLDSLRIMTFKNTLFGEGLWNSSVMFLKVP